MKIALFSTHLTWVTHFETELEIAQQHHNKGDTIDFYVCNEKNFNCCENLLSTAIKINQFDADLKTGICNQCIRLQERGFDLLLGSFNKFPLISNEQLLIDYKLDPLYLESVDKLKSLFHDETYDIGWSILSSMISFSRNPFIDLKDYKNYIEMLYCDSIRVYETAKSALLKNKYDRVYVFNGRYSYTKGLLRLGQKLGIPVHIHERGSVPEKYAIIINKTPHDIEHFYERVNEAWEKEDKSKRQSLGEKFYEDKIKGFGGSWKSFINNFEADRLPDDFNKNKQNIVLFTSSEDEFVSIDSSWNNPYFANQLEGIRFLCDEFSKANKEHQNLYIRIHPNSKEMDQRYIDHIMALSNKNIFIILPDSNINSYALMFNADKIITFGSTMTIEAVYWKKPVIMLGRSFFSAFKGPMIPQSKDEIIPLCFEQDTKAGTQSDAIKIGYYLRTFGIKYKYYKPESYKEGYFNGLNIVDGDRKPYTYYYHRIINKIYKLIHS